MAKKTKYLFLDIETADLTGKRIIQIAIISEDKTRQFNVYINPRGLIPENTTSLTGLHYDCKNSLLYKNGYPLKSYSISKAIELMLDFLNSFEDENLILVCHNGFCYDFPIIIKTVKRLGFVFPQTVFGFTDTLPMFKKFLKCNSYKLSDIVSHLGLENKFTFHDALFDNLALISSCKALTEINCLPLSHLLSTYFKETKQFCDKIK